MSTNFDKTLVWKYAYYVQLWRHRQHTQNANDHHMPLNETPPMKIFCVRRWCLQRRIFIFGVQGYFKLGVLLEGSRRLMSYKLSLHVLVTFTEQVVPIHKHITLFWIPSISGTKTVIMILTKKPAVKLFDNQARNQLRTPRGGRVF